MIIKTKTILIQTKEIFVLQILSKNVINFASLQTMQLISCNYYFLI